MWFRKKKEYLPSINGREITQDDVDKIIIQTIPHWDESMGPDIYMYKIVHIFDYHNGNIDKMTSKYALQKYYPDLEWKTSSFILTVINTTVLCGDVKIITEKEFNNVK